jgi:hypothetical protein
MSQASASCSLRAAGPRYRRRRPEGTALYRVIQRHLETFVARVEAAVTTVHWPAFVLREFFAFLTCGILAHGFARVFCRACGKSTFVAFSCRGRGFCPSCGGRRMAETAAHLVDHVLPHVPVRQWVLTVPFALRYRMAYDRKVLREVRRVFLRTIFAHLRRRARARGLIDPECGAVSFVQRFGSALNLNPHLHVLVLDGVYAPVEPDGPLLFHRLPDPTDAEIGKLLTTLRKRLATRFRRLALAPPESEPDGEDPALPFESESLAATYAAAVQGRDASGAPVTRIGRNPEAPFVPLAGARLAVQHGFSLHAGVRISGSDRERLERLVRYVARPAIASERLELADDGSAIYHLRRPFSDGTRAVRFDPLTFLERLAALVPPPRAHLVTYHGILAPNAAYRDAVVPHPGSASRPGPLRRHRAGPAAPDDDDDERRRRLTWAQLLLRVFRIDVLECPHCGSRRRLIALITDPPVVRDILVCVGLDPDPPPRAPPREDPPAFDPFTELPA